MTGQQSATCHTANETTEQLQDLFLGNIISKRGDIEWPPRSPYLNAPNFFLWGFLKSMQVTPIHSKNLMTFVPGTKVSRFFFISGRSPTKKSKRSETKVGAT